MGYILLFYFAVCCILQCGSFVLRRYCTNRAHLDHRLVAGVFATQQGELVSVESSNSTASNAVSKRGPLPAPVSPPRGYIKKSAEEKFQATAERIVAEMKNARIVSTKWIQDRVEVVVDSIDKSDPEGVGLGADDIYNLQKQIAGALELDPHTHYLMTEVEVSIVAYLVLCCLWINSGWCADIGGHSRRERRAQCRPRLPLLQRF